MDTHMAGNPTPEGSAVLSGSDGGASSSGGASGAGKAAPEAAINSPLEADSVEAYRFLMFFYHHRRELDNAKVCATRLLDTGGVERDEAKRLLQEISGMEVGGGGGGGGD